MKSTKITGGEIIYMDHDQRTKKVLFDIMFKKYRKFKGKKFKIIQ